MLALEKRVVEELKKYDLTLVTAESCTGGMIGARIANVPGASEVFYGGFITYSNEMKQKIIKVSKKTLKKHGAVSKQTAKEMAKGAAKQGNAKIAVSVTGIAGPDGGTPEKPVGLVYIGCYIHGKVKVKKCNFSGDRQKIREQTVEMALQIIEKSISKHYMS